MGDTVREKIIQNMVTTLQGITVAAGYNNTLASVQRYKAFANVTLDVPAVLVGEGAEDCSDHADPLTSCNLTVFLAVVTRQAESDTAATGAVLNSLLGDIKKALMIDHTRGGYAVDTNIKYSEPYEIAEGNPQVGLLITVEIEYRHLITNPESSR